jgi:hypothetical protein
MRKNKTVADAMVNGNWIRDIMHDITAKLMTQYIILWELVQAAEFNGQDQETDEIFGPEQQMEHTR